MTRRLTSFGALTFDCYGTLIDWESGIWDALQPLLHSNGCKEVTRSHALEAFADLETEVQTARPSAPYPEILKAVHDELAGKFGLETTDPLSEAFGASVPLWPAFPDSADALRALKAHYKLVILSNVDRRSFRASNRKLGVTFDAIYTAEEIGSYKPSLNNFDHMVARLAEDHAIARDAILHTAQSLFHDHVPARQAGLARAWIDRQGLAEGGPWGATTAVSDPPDVDFRFPSLIAMANAVNDEVKPR